MKTIDKRKITRKSIEKNIVGEINGGDYIVMIDGVKMFAMYRKENRYNIYAPTCDKDDPEANRIDIIIPNEDGDFSYTPDKIIRF